MSHQKTPSRRRAGGNASSSTVTTDSTRGQSPTRTSGRPAWERHDLATSEGRIALAPLAESLTSLADVTAMRTYVRTQADRIWAGRQPLTSVRDALKALDDREKALTAEATSTANAAPPSRTTPVRQAEEAKPGSEPAPTAWNANDIKTARGRRQLLGTVGTISDAAELDAMAKALDESFPGDSELETVQRLRDGITARKAALVRAASTGQLTKTRRTEPQNTVVQVPTQRTEPTTRARWKDDAKTADGAIRLRAELAQL